MFITGLSVTEIMQVKKAEIRPTLSIDVSYMFEETADFDVKVGSALPVEQAAYGDIPKTQITFKHRLSLRLTLGCGLETGQFLLRRPM